MTRWIRSERLIRSRMMQAMAIRLQGRDAPALLFVLACLMLPTATSYADTPPKRLVIAHAAAWTPSAFLGADGEPKGFVGAVGTTLREADNLARLRGDEFVALLPETTHDAAVLLARRVLLELRGRRFDQAGESIEISFSAGVAEFEDDASIDDWIRRADTRLYRSKTEGRAQVSAG